jgi:glutaredoxin-like protein NrdH
MRTDSQSTSTIYSAPNCMQCVATKREFDKRGLSYSLVDVSVDDSAREMLAGMGYRSAPVVIAASGQHWSGHRPDRIGELSTPTVSTGAPDRTPLARSSTTLDDGARQWAQDMASRMRSRTRSTADAGLSL